MKKEKKTIIDIIKHCDWKDVKKSLQYYYGYTPKKAESYHDVFDHVAGFKKRKYKNHENEVLEVSICGSKEDYIDEDGLDESYHVATNEYSLSFRKWREVSNIVIAGSTLGHFKYHEIVAHFLWEITFYGTEKDMEKTGKELFKTTAKAIKEIKARKK